MWTCAVPIGIIFSRYFKWWGPWYLIIHFLLMAATIGLTMWSASKRYQDEEAILPMDDQDNQAHMVIGLIILSLVVGEGVLGLAAFFSKIFSKQLLPISYARKLHQVVGWGLLISALVNNKFGWELYDDSQNKTYIGFMFAVIGPILLFEFRHQISPYWRFLSFYFRRNKQLSHIEAIEKISKEDREYVFLEELVLDITWFKYDHPGGYNMLKNVIGEDVGKYMIGCSSQKNYNPYTHTIQALEMAGHLSIATIPYPKNFLISTNKSNQNLMTWKIIEKNQINENHFIITMTSDEFEMNENWEKAEWLGKHFKLMMPLSFSNVFDKRKNISRYYSCFFVNLDKWRQEILAEGYEVSEPINKEKKGLKFIFKVYPLGVVSNYLNNLLINDTILLKGPLGPGLGIDNLSGSFLAVAGGTGLIPFLDLVRYLWVNRENPHEFKLMLYVSFGSRKDAFAIDLLKATEQVIDENIFKLILIFTSEKGNQNIPEIMVKLGKNNPKRAWICGPSGFNRFVEANLLESGLDRKRIVIM
ncbi:unnamed protein product [Blepharisma stoltei]|uniref:Cytochrome b561 domain-containing protein n=1 Tax=Blepharisma stoltei TaxID=1481888 RepID=A0AAU9JXG7_9CILI|nr:unnamed protein product [Blepharisma stoltei]